MTLSHTQLQALVDTARQKGQREVNLHLPDGTLVTVLFQPPPGRKPTLLNFFIAHLNQKQPQPNRN